MVKKSLFRTASLERISSPEQLNEYIKVASPSVWLVLGALFLALIAAVIWGFLGSMPATVVTGGAYFPDGALVAVEAEGTVALTRVRAGEHVEAGDALLAFDTGEEVISPIAGTVVSLLEPGDTAGLANVAARVLPDGASADTVICYCSSEVAASIQPGMEAQVSPSGANRDDYGYMKGTVERVDAFPSNARDLLDALGSEQIVSRVATDESPVKLIVRLEADDATQSGFRWSGAKGADFRLSTAHICTVQIVTENRRPIDAILGR